MKLPPDFFMVSSLCCSSCRQPFMMVTGNTEAAKDILQQKEKILDLGIKMRKSHVERVGEGKCKAKLTEPYNRIIHHIDRMGNCCINIVDAVQGKAGQTYLETVA